MQDPIAQYTGKEGDFKNSYVRLYNFEFHIGITRYKHNLIFMFSFYPKYVINNV